MTKGYYARLPNKITEEFAQLTAEELERFFELKAEMDKTKVKTKLDAGEIRLDASQLELVYQMIDDASLLAKQTNALALERFSKTF